MSRYNHPIIDERRYYLFNLRVNLLLTIAQENSRVLSTITHEQKRISLDREYPSCTAQTVYEKRWAQSSQNTRKISRKKLRLILRAFLYTTDDCDANEGGNAY